MATEDTPIYVTKTFLPPLQEYQAYLDQIWDTAQLTNKGPLLREFEAKTSEYLAVENFHFVSNGTMALQIALRGLGITEGEVITTPFTYVATSSSILWERCRPVFVDIETDTLCIDPAKIEAAITAETKAIMPVHVFGNPCDTEAIQAIADKHNLKIIYDAAHAFGAQLNGKSLLNYGDISIGSFHATKLFHTIEGGCLVVRDKKVSDEIELIKRFGHDGDEHSMLGINAKASEFQAAMGLCNLKYLEENIAKRRQIVELYDSLLQEKFRRPRSMAKNFEYNYGYYPIILESETVLKESVSRLKAQNIHPRRYFWPSLNTLPYMQSSAACPISEDIAARILCLPLYADLEAEHVKTVCETLLA